MNLVKFLTLDDFEKLLISELLLGKELEEASWTQHGTYTNVFYLDLPNDGEVVKVEEDGLAYTEKFLISDCNNTASTFYFDDLLWRLYCHTSGSDSPASQVSGSPKYNITAWWYQYFSNRAKQIQPCTDILKEKNGGFEFWVSNTDAEEWVEKIQGSSTINKESSQVDGNDSAYACRFDIDASNNVAQEDINITLPPGRKVKLRVSYKNSISGKTARIFLADSGSNVFLNSSGFWQTTWAAIDLDNVLSYTTYEIIFVTHPDYSNYVLNLRRNSAASSSIYFDNVEAWRYRRAVDCKAFLSKDAVSPITQAVGDYYRPDELQHFGGLKIKNVDGWFWNRRQNNKYLWHNTEIMLRVGQIDEAYEELALFFKGVTRKPSFDYQSFQISFRDERVLLTKIPVTRFDSTNYPNCEDGWKNKKIPILLGEVEDIEPPQCNTSTKTFKVSETTFNSVTVGIYAIDHVYKNGTALTAGTQYTTNLNAGTFTLLVSLSSADKITCDARGLKIDILTGAYAYLIADWIYFLYVTLNGISKYKINLKSLIDLKSGRIILSGHWISDEIDSSQLMILWKQTAVFQCFQNLEGIHVFPYYKEEVPDDAPRYFNEDYVVKPKFEEDTDQCFKIVICRGHYLPSSSYYKYEKFTEAGSAEWDYKERGEISFDLVSVSEFQTGDICDNYSAMLKAPIEVMTVTLKGSAILLNPTDKIVINYSEKDSEGNEVTVYENEPFRILSLTKDINTGNVEVKAIRDVADFFWTIS